MNETSVRIVFGGEARELWTDDGLTVSYSGGTELLALFDSAVPGGWLASAPEPERRGDVKADMAEHSRARELACRINDGAVSPLTLAYFRASAGAQSSLASLAPDLPEGALPIRRRVDGRYDTLILPELLRLLLDERGMSWDDAVSAVAHGSVYDTSPCERPERAAYRESAPLSAIAALQPRTARLIAAVNEKLCERLWAAFPGDWRRIGSAAAIIDGAVSFPRLAASLCGKISCSREERSGALRTFYTIFPEKFEDDI